MAIYSCNLTSIGRTTHAAGTAGAHVRYIARPEASPALLCEHMPENPAAARTFLDRGERDDRKNARVIDKIRIALPRELTEEQRVDLVRDFMADLGKGRVPWFAGIHQSGDDVHNPHAHIAVRDRDIETGKRVLRLSDSAKDRQGAGLEPKAVDWVRERWEHHANRALERAGVAARIDRRSLEAQGIEREPTIHIGPRAQHIDATVTRPESKVRTDGRGRVIDYPLIDAGRTRNERHAEIIDMNLERDARSPNFETRAVARFEREQRAQDKLLSSRLVAEARRRTLIERRLKQEHGERLAEARAAYAFERKAASRATRERYAPALVALRQTQAEERAALQARQGSLWQRVLSVVDVSGRTKRRRDAMREGLAQEHKASRASLAQDVRASRIVQLQAVDARHVPILDEIKTARLKSLDALEEKHREAELWADRERQDRECLRAAARGALDRQMQAWKAAQRDTQRSRGNDRGLDL